MIPVGAIVVLVSVVVRLLTQSQRRTQPASSQTSILGQPIGWLGFSWLFLAPAAAGLAGAVASGVWTMLPPLAVLLVVLFPWPITRMILIPLGMPRAAYYVARLSDLWWRGDRSGGAALAAAWALLRQPTHREKAAAWIELKLQKSEKRLMGGAIVAHGLIAAARGDLEAARAVLESVTVMAPRAVRAIARDVALEWLIADAAALGDWKRVSELGERPVTRTVRLMGGVADRLLRNPEAPANARLYWRWLVAPRRRWTRAVVLRAVATPYEPRERTWAHSDGPGPVVSPPPEGADALTGALWQHAELLRRPAARLSQEELVALGRAWDAALADAGLREQLLARAVALGVPGIDGALTKLRAAAEADVGAAAEAAGIRLGELNEPGELLGRAAYLEKERMLSELELAASSLARRTEERRELPPLDEWREWLGIRKLYERAAAGGLDARRLAYSAIHHEVCELAVWLFNIREEKPIANAMFRWLLAEAERVGATESARVNRNNVACGF